MFQSYLKANWMYGVNTFLMARLTISCMCFWSLDEGEDDYSTLTAPILSNDYYTERCMEECNFTKSKFLIALNRVKKSLLRAANTGNCYSISAPLDLKLIAVNEHY